MSSQIAPADPVAYRLAIQLQSANPVVHRVQGAVIRASYYCNPEGRGGRCPRKPSSGASPPWLIGQRAGNRLKGWRRLDGRQVHALRVVHRRRRQPLSTKRANHRRPLRGLRRTRARAGAVGHSDSRGSRCDKRGTAFVRRGDRIHAAQSFRSQVDRQSRCRRHRRPQTPGGEIRQRMGM